jgi:hypothetical protein
MLRTEEEHRMNTAPKHVHGFIQATTDFVRDVGVGIEPEENITKGTVSHSADIRQTRLSVLEFSHVTQQQ